MNQLINHGGDCRTAPATPGLVIVVCGGKVVALFMVTVQLNTFIKSTSICTWGLL